MTGLGASPWSAHLETTVLPWWERHAVDDELGGVFTCFDNRGRLLSHDKYTWSQGRWAWVCAELAEAAARGEVAVDGPLWSDRATRTAAFLVERSATPDARTAFVTDRAGAHQPSGPDGEVSTSVFADLFAVLGIAGGSRAAREEGDERVAPWLDAASRMLLVAERSIADRTARTEPYPVPAGYRDLAGPMTLVHVADELARAGGGAPAEGVRDRALSALLDDGGMLGATTWAEFRADAGPAGTMLDRHRTPGHLLECLWMIVHAQERARRPVGADRLAALATRALEIGWDDEHGGLLRYCDEAGGPPRGTLLAPGEPGRYEQLVLDTWDTKLWWVHAEAMYATELLARISGSAELTTWHERVAEYTLATFPDRERGEWIQVRARDGRPLDRVVALPVKDPFHIIRALLLLARGTAPAPA
ncbi:AGE family epimerase/isomerase [Krasilnikoviella flava]|uniref:N-acylglucosamine 2-epimerase n=1 Tax=Krasilnikoviella flava TaxID=526729 RepID=A0A1T5L5C5_9MICO|nr:AGE family epimerase/isomerase [Krasilnikoviella flava]SKC70905.1 N-acylglucosamine 2-epimerase [Krasilnikoviella flava]